ncbi:zonadhesin-like isoform X2 [Acanthopagrus latus]|uniref:zonadhesin-like isoform X2 n=1 Tax=Acanthopagrus latus TaxID=8177 RepID=UPI00187CF85C|nr:zonadhesin-like isoform X2 [Acanthopagrus latus]
MLGGLHTDLLVTVTLLLLAQTGTRCRAENDFSLITLPEVRPSSEYVTVCYTDTQNNQLCDWTRNRLTSSTGDAEVDILESATLEMEGEACLEFWYRAPFAAEGSELRALVKSSTRLVEIWSSPALPGDSWRQVFIPLNIIEPETRVVFEAAQAVSMEQQIAFHRIGVRRGPCGQQCESNTEFWTDESTRCLCSAGQLSCSPSRCPEGQICGPQRRPSGGISTSGTCTIHSNTDCSTFDGVLFRFMAPCTYTLAKTCSPAGALPVFSVEVVNEQNGNASLPAVQQVIVEIGNLRVSLLKRQTDRVVVNGVWRKLPLKLGAGAVSIKGNPAVVTLVTKFGLSVSYDNTGAVHISLLPAYSDHVCGMCGNFNHNRGDEFRRPDGTDAQDATALAESWQTGESALSCETILVPHKCDPMEEAEYAGELYCGGLLSSTGPFADCLSILGAESYFRGCVVGMCSSHGDPEVLCTTLKAYADICQEAGVALPAWRNSSFCPLQCAVNSHYNSCADGCPEVCSGQDIVGSCGSCVERCECDFGFKLSGGKCVPAEDCGCMSDGKHYERGEEWLEGECAWQCQCMAGGVVTCSGTECGRNEVCRVEEGVKGCFPLNAATCSVYGDPHYITFDGMAYDFQGGCSYTLTTTCGDESSVQFTVIGHNMHPPLGNFTRSKLEAVTLQTDELNVTLSQRREIYVNGVPVPLPFSRKGMSSSIWVFTKGNYIILETTFGLRMMIDGENRLFLQVDERYKYELCGLCGTYSEQQDDDFVTPGGQNATGAFEFANSWRVPDNNECVAHPNDPRLCDYNEENEAYNKCYALLGDAFKSCHKVIHPSIFLSSCVYDYCATSGDNHTLCESLGSYAAACQVAGVELSDWQTGAECADPTTTPAPVTPTPAQTKCPLNCDFEENLCGWEQLIQDTYDWTRQSGPTPSDQTGPSEDHTTGAGFYMYLEGDRVIHGDSARLMSSACQYSGPLCLQFWYHMYGSATAMALNIYLLRDNKTTKIWAMMNNQGPQWHQAYADITVAGPFQIIVEGIRGSTTQSDVAIDDISIYFGSCSVSSPGLVGGTERPFTTSEILPAQPVCSIDCSFDSNLCSWNQMVTDAFDWTWQSGSTLTPMTGPSADHTGGGHYLYIEASSVTHGDTARLISSECSDSGPQCLQFWYHMYGSADTMGLHVYLIQNKSADAVFWRRNDQGDAWQLAQVDFTTTEAYQIIFEGRRGSNEESDVAIDDVKLYHGRCSDLSGVVTPPPKPDGNTTAPPSVPVPTTAAPEPPVVNATVQLPVTAQPPVANATMPPMVEEPTISIDTINVIEAQNNRQPSHPVCSIDCSFDSNLCSWNQMVTDAFDWTWQSGSTPTPMTGPSADHTGGGHYLYIKASSVTHGDTARLISSECSDSGPQCLQFWYHMHGSADTMGLHVYLLQNNLADAVFWKRNDQGDAWQLAQVDFTTNEAYQIIFEGRRGSNEESDVAIDDVKLYHGRCSDLSGVVTPPPKPVGNTTAPPSVPVPTTAAPEPPVVNATVQLPVTAQPPVANATMPPMVEVTTNLINKDNVTGVPDNRPPSHPVCSINCSFDSNLCSWNQMVTDAFDWTWQSGSTPTPMTGPSADHTGGGHYLYIEASSVTHGDTARLISSECSDSGPQCLQFWYHMYGSADTMGLHVYLLQNNLADAVFWRRNDQGDAWQLAQVDFTATEAFRIIFEGRRGSNDQSDVAIDDVSLHRGRCADLVKPTTPAPTDFNSIRTEGPEIPPANSSTATPTSTSKPTTTTITTAATETHQTLDPDVPTTTTTTTITTITTAATTTTTTTQLPTTVTTTASTTSSIVCDTQPSISTPQPTTTTKPESQTTTGPELSTTSRPQLPTETHPQPQTTAGPQPPTETHPQPQTTAGPQPPTETHPQPQTTAGPQPPTETHPQPQTTAGPQPPTETHPQPQTTAGPQPPTETHPQPQTTAGPHPPTETHPQPQTTVKPQPPASTTPNPPTTAGPQPTTTIKPHPTTAGPQPTTTAAPQPTTTPLPTPSCAQNSHYTTCVPACTPTCSHLNGPPHCSGNQRCEPGCVCNEGFVRKDRACVPIQHCGCVDSNGTKYDFREEWYTNHCIQKCECKERRGVGKIECDDEDECDGNAVCLQNVEGDYYCQSTGFDECTIRSDSEYRTFDRKKYDFEGEHSYVLVQTKNLPNYLPDVYIEGINTRVEDDDSHQHGDSSSEENHSHRVRDEDDDDSDEDDDDDSEEHEDHHRLQGLKIRVYSHTVEFKKKRRLVVDGRRTNAPVSPAAGLKIYEHSSRIYLKTDFGLSVEFDGHHTPEIILPRLYMRKVGGLCGNFDRDKGNDWTKPDGSRARNVREFGESWRV